MLFFVNSQTKSELFRVGNPSPDPKDNRQIYSFANPVLPIESEQEFFLIYHVSSTVHDKIRSPNISSLLVGTRTYLEKNWRLYFCLYGTIIGSFS